MVVTRRVPAIQCIHWSLPRGWSDSVGQDSARLMIFAMMGSRVILVSQLQTLDGKMYRSRPDKGQKSIPSLSLQPAGRGLAV